MVKLAFVCGAIAKWEKLNQLQKLTRVVETGFCPVNGNVELVYLVIG